MKYSLPPLPYDFNALEPYIDARTMEIHYTKHHQGYINNLNNALEKHPSIQDKPLYSLLQTLDIIPADIRQAVRNHGGGHSNHSLFWLIMKKNGGGEPTGKMAEAIKNSFGTYEAFKVQFSAAAMGVFGSGWAWLVVDLQGKLVIYATCNQDSPLSYGLFPVFGIDVWEHAYYLHYQNRRADYMAAWWQVLNWEQIEENYRALID